MESGLEKKGTAAWGWLRTKGTLSVGLVERKEQPRGVGLKTKGSSAWNWFKTRPVWVA